MTLVPDEYVFAPATEREFGPFVLAEFPDARVSSDCFDLFAEIPGPDLVPVETAYRIVRAMRGGADHDGERPADWHVRSLEPIRDIPEQPGMRTGPWPVVGTGIWFSRSYQLPGDYDETDAARRTFGAPGTTPAQP